MLRSYSNRHEFSLEKNKNNLISKVTFSLYESIYRWKSSVEGRKINPQLIFLNIL